MIIIITLASHSPPTQNTLWQHDTTLHLLSTSSENASFILLLSVVASFLSMATHQLSRVRLNQLARLDCWRYDNKFTSPSLDVTKSLSVCGWL